MRFITAIFLCSFWFSASGQAMIKNAVIKNAVISPAGAGGGSFTYTATKFLASGPTYIVHSGDYTGGVNSKQFTISFWFKVNSGDATIRRFYRHGGDFVSINFDDGTLIGGSVANDIVFTFNDTGAVNARYLTAATFPSGSTWHHLAMSFDTSNSANRWVYVDGSADAGTWGVYVNSAIDFNNGGDESFCASQTGGLPFDVSISELWMAQGQLIDLSVSANLQKFRSAGGKPVNLGSDGSTPTGTVPTVYLHNPFGTFQNNLGSGGNFTVTGTLQDDASIP